MGKIKRVFFYCTPHGSPQRAAFQHNIISIGEGLKELGIEFYSNVNYWELSPNSGKYLFNYKLGITPDVCDAVVINNEWFMYGREIPNKLFEAGRKYKTVYIDSDGLYAYYLKKEFRQFDIILRTQYNRKVKYPKNIKPWAFGLSNRIISYTQGGLPFEKRKKTVLNNFRVSQQVRKIANKSFIIPFMSRLFLIDSTFNGFNDIPTDPYEKLLWEQTGRRHYSSYYEKLKKSALCGCFAGTFIIPFPPDINNIFFKFFNLWNLNTVRFGIKTDTITQYDGWRFWETLSAGCVALHADFERYGMQLPVQPVNFRHYIGIDFYNLKESFNKIKRNIGLLPEISKEGRKWALENYSPKAVAKRFIQYIS